MNDPFALTPWESLKIALRQHEYLHVLLHPMLAYGLLMGVMALMIALFLRQRSAEITGLILVAVASLCIWPVVYFGETSYDGTYGLISMTDDLDGTVWLKEHKTRAEQVEWIFYAVASLAVVALALPPFLPRTSKWLVVATLIGALIAIAAGGWVSYAGGRVKHKEFRYGPPPIRGSASP